MRRMLSALTAVLTMALAVSPSEGQGPVIYPAKGQSHEQQNTDKGECHVWAVQQSGFDPAKAPAATAPPPSQPGGQRARGAARGAAVGAVGGAIAGDAGTGAAAGAAMGTMAGGMKKRDQAKAQQAQAQQQQQATAQAQAGYSKAIAACLEGRGYTVK
jgi:Glycine-zipper domain